MRIKAEHVSYTYKKHTPFEKEALKGITFTIEPNTVTAVLGQTGSGKSTCIQLLNGLLKPSAGTLQIGEWTIGAKTKQKALHDLRRHVGMVFQYPEQQLFHDTVLEDVCYGPMNHGATQEEAEALAKKWLERTGISAELYDRSPFEISGGQMRRVAIAGVLALEPSFLILDEPTAGLDPEGQVEMMELFHAWKEEKEERSLLLVTHRMEDAAYYADHLIVLHKGTIRMTGDPQSIFRRTKDLADIGLQVPATVRIWNRVLTKLQETDDKKSLPFTIEETASSLVSLLKKGSEKDV